MSVKFGMLPYNGGWSVRSLTTTPEIIYSVPAGKRATVTINVENVDGEAVPKVRIARVSLVAPDAYAAPGVPDDRFLLEYKRSATDNYPIERTGIALGSDQAIVAWADRPGLVINISGIEE